MTATKPGLRPAVPHFSSGPCAKRPGWNLQALTDAALGRSHRAKIGKAKLKRAIDQTREVLGVPADYRIGIVPASDTGAVDHLAFGDEDLPGLIERVEAGGWTYRQNALPNGAAKQVFIDGPEGVVIEVAFRA